MTLYVVVNNEWNRVNCPELIGQISENPPSYAAVAPVGE